MELFAKDRGHPGTPAKLHVIHKLSFFVSKIFFPQLAAKISKKHGVKWGYKYRVITSIYSCFRQLSNETNRDFLELFQGFDRKRLSIFHCQQLCVPLVERLGVETLGDVTEMKIPDRSPAHRAV